MGEGGEISVKEKGKEEIEVMDTPDRSKNAQIATSLSKFEESPVFSFLNSLSPIKPVKSLHISQTINPLSFATLPSVFTSPHVTSIRESRFLRRQQLPDPSKPEFSFDDRSNGDTNNLNTDKKSDELQISDPRISDGHGSSEPSGECSKLIAEFPENTDHDYIGSNSVLGGLEGKLMTEYGCNSSAHVPFVDEASSQRVLYGNELNPEGVSELDQSKEATSCDWESLISESLIFESPNAMEPYKMAIDRGTSFYPSTHSLCAIESDEQVEEQCEPENLSTQPGEGSEISGMMGNGENHDAMAGPSMNHPSSISNYEHLSSFYRGIRRRCLVFEMGTGKRKYLDENSGSGSSTMLQSDGNPSSNDRQQLIPTKTGPDSLRRALPGIGLHLNALATTTKDYKINHEASVSGRLLIGPSSSLSFPPPATDQALLNINPTLEGEIDSIENHVLLLEDANQISGQTGSDEPGHTSPRKKKRRLEQSGEGEACKRCNCKKSKCLKLYCECFAAGVYCVEPCACIDCFNKPIHEDTVLATRKQIESRNPLAFAPKVIRSSDSISEIGDDPSKTPASARHKRGCNCKKSGCLKKYCECYQGGVGCSINCRCEGCKNAFGRKDGSSAISMEEYEEDEIETTDKIPLEKTIQKDLEVNTDPVLPETPLQPGRYEISAIRQLSAQNLFSSKKKPPRSSFPSIGSSSSSFSGQVFAKPSFFQAPPKFDQQFETVNEDEIPDFLQVSSPLSGIKSSSPNRKRVSPPHHGLGMSPGLRSSRKLILQSIPSFPSLTSNP